MLRVQRLIFLHINVQIYTSLIDDPSNKIYIAKTIDDQWSVVSHVRMLNVSLHWDYHVCIVYEFMVLRSEEIKLLLFSVHRRKAVVCDSYYVFQYNKFEFFWKHKYISIQNES